MSSLHNIILTCGMTLTAFCFVFGFSEDFFFFIFVSCVLPAYVHIMYVWCLRCFCCFQSLLFWGPTTQPQIITYGDLRITCECPPLAQLVSSQLFLNYLIYFLPLGFYCSLFYCSVYLLSFFLSFLFFGNLCNWVAAPQVLSLLLLLLTVLSDQISPSILSACQPSCPLSPALLLAVQLFIRPIRCFR